MTVNTDEANPLRIGLILRAIDDVDGQGIYIRKLCDALFDLDTRNEYVAFYSDERQAGRYANRDNVREIVVRGRGKLLWDQRTDAAGRASPRCSMRPLASQTALTSLDQHRGRTIIIARPHLHQNDPGQQIVLFKRNLPDQ